jgi:hypothetical protein
MHTEDIIVLFVVRNESVLSIVIGIWVSQKRRYIA